MIWWKSSSGNNNNSMAYYDDPKHKFLDVITSCKIPVVKAFLRAKAEDHFLKQDIKNAHIEQWLYNEDFKEIDLEFRGFVKGYLFKSKEYCDADVILGQRELFAQLAKIYKEMNSENNWGKTEKNFKDWFYE